MEEKKGRRIEAKTQGTLQLGLEQNGCTSREKEEEIEDEIHSTGTEYEQTHHHKLAHKLHE